MRRGIAIIISVCFVHPWLAWVSAAPGFENGQSEVIGDFEPPGFQDTVYLVIPSEYYVRSALLNVTGLSARNISTAYPEAPSLSINKSVFWSFQNTGFGPFGRQDRFYNEKRSALLQLGNNGGSQQTWIRMPKNATVLKTTMGVTIQAPSKQTMDNTPDLIFQGQQPNGDFGWKLSSAGDVNKDGFDDVLITAERNNTGGEHNGRAFIYFGKQSIDNTASVELSGSGCGGYFGVSCSGAGDVNGDGYSDVLVGESHNDTKFTQAGCVYLFHGNTTMDNVSDMAFIGDYEGARLGQSVSIAGDVNKDGCDEVILGSYWADANGLRSGYAVLYSGNGTRIADFPGEAPDDKCGRVANAGDVNGDGFDDVIVGAFGNNAGGIDAGRAYIYYGGKQMDNLSDVVITGGAAGDNWGAVVSGLGDVNGDGYDDVIVTGYTHTNFVSIYYGGQQMDGNADVTIHSPITGDCIGYSAAGAGDVNGDGYSDIIVGAPDATFDGVKTGGAYVYFGGNTINTTPDLILHGKGPKDYFGDAVACAGDVNSDGYDDVIVGAPNNKTYGAWSGCAYLFFGGPTPPALQNPGIIIGSKTIWNRTGYVNGSVAIPDFSNEINDYLQMSSAYSTDQYGNNYVDIPIIVKAGNEGNFTFNNLVLNYDHTITIPDFSTVLNLYIQNQVFNKHQGDNITIPIDINSKTAGRVRLSDIIISRDYPPVLIKDIWPIELEEDSAVVPFIDLSQYFQDDTATVNNPTYNVVTSTNSSCVRLWVTVNKYLSVDAMTGDTNDNWTGTVEVVVACTDPWGQRTESNPFVITIKNVNDPPIITSIPLVTAVRGQIYHYNATAVDGDNDTLTFSLPTAPDAMIVDPKTGCIQWTPMDGGLYPVNLSVTDGNSSDTQVFNISVPFANRAPRIMNASIPEATAGKPYSFRIPAVDDDGDTLSYLLVSQNANMTVDPSTGLLNWTPDSPGTVPVSVRVSDNEFVVIYNFSIRVNAQGATNRLPVISSKPSTTAALGIPYSYDVMATDPDKDPLTFSLIDSPSGMVINPATGKLTWKPSALGNFTVKVKVSDGKGGDAFQEFRITVHDRLLPTLEFTKPYEAEKVQGKVTVSGTATKGTLDIVKVQFRVDSGEWTDALGTASWTYSLDTVKLKNGNHTLSVRAYDGAGYSEVIDRAVIVDNPKNAAKGFIPSYGALFLITGLLLCVLLQGYRQRKPG